MINKILFSIINTNIIIKKLHTKEVFINNLFNNFVDHLINLHKTQIYISFKKS